MRIEAEFDLTTGTAIEADFSVDNVVPAGTYQPLLTSANAGDGISITGSGSSVVIANTQTSAEWGNIDGDIADQEDLQQALDEKQDVIDSDNKLSSDLVDDTNHTNKFVTASQITSWTNKVSATYNSTNEEIIFA